SDDQQPRVDRPEGIDRGVEPIRFAGAPILPESNEARAERAIAAGRTARSRHEGVLGLIVWALFVFEFVLDLDTLRGGASLQELGCMARRGGFARLAHGIPRRPFAGIAADL